MPHHLPKTILLVEDDAIIAMAEAQTLERFGHRVITVSSGELAVDAVAAMPEIDLVLMDIHLGSGIDGTQAATLILKLRDLPLIFLSSHTEREVVEKTEGITSYGYIVKNSGETVLLASIKMALRLFDAKMKEKEKDALIQDLTTRQRLEDSREKRLLELTRPLDQPDGITFEDLFDLATMQKLQDEFSTATGVASLICRPDGTPITRPSNFCRLCADVIRSTELGRRNCQASDARLGCHQPAGPNIQPCLSGGLWDAGASITVGDKHIATWLVGQVRDATQNEDKMRDYARAIGADELAVLAAFREVPAMSFARFTQIARTVFHLAGQLSTSAYQNIRQARLITKRTQMELALRESETLLCDAIEFTPVPLNIADKDGAILIINRKFTKNFGYDLADLPTVGAWMARAYPDPDYRAEVLAQWNEDVAAAKQDGTATSLREYIVTAKDGSRHDVEITAKFLGEMSVVSFTNITGRKRANAIINNLLAEKELILKEVHHRIKNNMATLYSLLSLQAGTLQEPAAISALKDSGSRVLCMMKLYDKLYQSANFDSMPVGNYLPSLVDDIIANFPNQTSVRVEKQIDDFELDSKRLQPLGIIINELLTNIMKYAFTGRATGLITVAVSLRDHQVALLIQDDGVGMPETINADDSTGFGLTLVGILATQLKGVMRWEQDNGTRTTLEFAL